MLLVNSLPQVLQGSNDMPKYYQFPIGLFQPEFPTGIGGNLTVLNGQTVVLDSSKIQDYANVTVEAGGVLEFSGDSPYAILGVRDVLTVDGIIRAQRGEHDGGVFNFQTPRYETLSLNIVQKDGGNGGGGGTSSSSSGTFPGRPGGSSAFGNGGGGGGGSGQRNFGTAGDDAIETKGGNGGRGGPWFDGVTFAGGVGGNIYGNGGGGGTTGGNGEHGGGGGGGGAKGSHGQGFALYAGTIVGTGTISASGGNGGNGGPGSISGNGGGGPDGAGGGGGGGGAGGSAGNLWLRYRSSLDGGVTLEANGGNAGNGGSGGPSAESSGGPGQPGEAGDNGNVDIGTY